MTDKVKVYTVIFGDAVLSGSSFIEPDWLKENNKVVRLSDYEALRKQLELARTYRGVEGYACPLCTYQDGVFLDYCEPHRQLDVAQNELKVAQERIAELVKALKAIRTAGSKGEARRIAMQVEI